MLTEPQEPEGFACETPSVDEVARAALDVTALDHPPDFPGLCGIPRIAGRYLPYVAEGRHLEAGMNEPVTSNAQVGNTYHALIAHQQVGLLEVLLHPFKLLGRVQDLRTAVLELAQLVEHPVY